MKLKTILYATDLSTDSEPALEHAVFLARQHRAGLHMLHVFELCDEPVDSLALGTPYHEALEAQVQELTLAGMDRLISLAGARDLGIVKVQRRGRSVAGQILDHAARIGADLIVLGTHGRGNWGRALLGSVASEVLRRSKCHVLTVHQGGEVRPAARTNRILVPLRLTDPAPGVLACARALALGDGAELQLLHVVEGQSGSRFHRPTIDPHEWMTRVRPRVLADLRRLAAASRGPRVPRTLHVAEGPVGAGIADFAAGHLSDLIVAGLGAHAGSRRSFRGSTIDTIIRLAPCPVFTFKAPSPASARGRLLQTQTGDSEPGSPPPLGGWERS